MSALSTRTPTQTTDQPINYGDDLNVILDIKPTFPLTSSGIEENIPDKSELTKGKGSVTRYTPESNIEPSNEKRIAKPASYESYPDIEAQPIFRAHFTDIILADLNKLKHDCGQPDAAVPANNILHTIRSYRDESPYDPFLDILIALHDAMQFENRWIEYDAAQYEGAYKILKEYANKNLDDSKVSKAIIQLEELGFETLPFESELDFLESEVPDLNE